MTVGGWIIVLVFLVIVVAWSKIIVSPAEQVSSSQGWLFSAGLLVIIIAMWLITRRFAPPGKWRWGKKDSDNPNEDC